MKLIEDKLTPAFYINRNNNQVMDVGIRDILEKFILNIINKAIDQPDKIPQNMWDGTLVKLSDVIHRCEPDFVSEEITRIAKVISDNRVRNVIEQCSEIASY